MPTQPRRKSDAPLKGFNGLRASASGAYQRSSARRAIQEIEKDKRGWLRNGIAALAISCLGLGVAGAVAVTGSAHASGSGDTAGVVASQSGSSALGLTGNSRGVGTSRSLQRPQLASGSNDSTSSSDGKSVGEPLDGTVDMTARQDAQKHAKVADTGQEDAAAEAAAQAREKALKSTLDKTEKLSTKLSKAGLGAGGNYAVSSGDGQAHLPIDPGKFTIAATFGEVGSWARYHTGLDFAAPIGTPIHATADGVVTNSGIGPASSWAGNYVVIKFADGEQMLFAHMESTAVTNGQRVTGGQVIGHVGMTGRTFGPHTHVELYPRGITPGDVYSAVNPAPWFTAHGLKI